MSDDEGPKSEGSKLSDEEIARALSEMDLLIPETEDEVARMEAELDEAAIELPASLAQLSAPRGTGAPSEPVVPHASRAPAEVRSFEAARRRRGLHPGWGGAVGFVLGAAAASLLWLRSIPDPTQPPRVGGVGSELQSTTPTPKEKAPVHLDLSEACDGCCAGAACQAAPKELAECASGRACIDCSPADGKNAYRLRLSALGTSAEGKMFFEKHGAPGGLGLCASIRGNSLGCRPAAERPLDLVEWVSLPTATTSSQLVGGLELRLVTHFEIAKSPADYQTLAQWSKPVTVSEETLCKGVSARLKTPSGVDVGRVSVFFDDAYFVELGRAPTVKALLEIEQRFKFDGGSPKVYETSAASPRRFTLVVGPTDRKGANALRWQLLDQDVEAPITFGDEHRGAPRPR